MTTYRSAARKLRKFSEALRVGDATPGRLNAVIRSMRLAHGANMARHGRTLMRGALQIAVLDDVLGANPLAQVSRIESDRKPKGAPALTVAQLRDLLDKLRASEVCRQADLVDRSRCSWPQDCGGRSCLRCGGKISMRTRGRSPFRGRSPGYRVWVCGVWTAARPTRRSERLRYLSSRSRRWCSGAPGLLG